VHGGLGIGLTIVRHIVELHGGTVRAESGGEGAGSTFVVELPLGKTEEEQTRPPVRRIDGERIPPPAPQPAALSFADLSGLHVLIIDDEADAREVVSAMLIRAGAQVTAAGSVAETLELMTTIQPDVLVSDIAMPDRDGYELIRLVRELPLDRGGRVPAIALTAYAREEDRFRALTAGFQAHLAKPVTPLELSDAIQKVAAMLRVGEVSQAQS
jgi:CheY-like chemotaxis protein